VHASVRMGVLMMVGVLSGSVLQELHLNRFAKPARVMCAQTGFWPLIMAYVGAIDRYPWWAAVGNVGH